jgi:hypothetical protein
VDPEAGHHKSGLQKQLENHSGELERGSIQARWTAVVHGEIGTAHRKINIIVFKVGNLKVNL